MDDGGQRLLDVIEDTHVLETFLRENFSNSGLEDSSRYDNVNSSAESGLVSGGLDSFVFDGQLVDPLRGGPTHASHHTHQVSPHVLQQVLHPSSLSAAASLPGASHQLHPHQIHHHHQSHHLQQSNLLQQHHTQHLQHSHQSNHASISSPVGGTLDVDCIGRSRDSCGARNESDHTLQQLLASASPLGSSQQILQLHHQTHQHSLHQSHSQLQQLTQSHQHLQQQQHQSHHNQTLLPPAIQPPISNSSSLLQHQHLIDQSHRQQPQRQQQQRHHASQSHKLQQLSQSQESQTSDVSNGLLPIGLQPVSSSITTCNSLSAQQSPPIPVHSNQQDASRNSSKTSQANQVSSAVTNSISTKVIVPGISSQNIVQSGSHGITSRVQVVGGHNQVLNSAAQQLLATPSSQLFSGTQIVQPSIPTQVISGGSILAGGQVFSAPNVLPSGQVLSSMPNGQVFQGGQLLSNAQVLTNHLLGSSHVITTVGAISTPAAPLYVTPSGIASQIHQPAPPPPPVIHNAVGTLHQNAVITSSMTPLSSPSTISSSFTVPSKSPASSLPRASPGPSYPATPSPHHTTPSPASYPSKSPAPSPHSNVASLKSPAPPPSPAVTPTAVTSTSQSTQTVINTSSAPHGSTIVSGVVGNMGMVQGLVPHLPITKVGGNNGMVLTQGTNSVHVTPGIKQVVPSGQLIQIVSSQNAARQTVTIPHPKPIQPKQPQLLPKPSPQGNVRQSTPPPTGKTLIGSRPTPQNNQQPIVLGTGNQQQTVITGQQNLGSLLFNSPLLQGLQQPILIPQPNGVQLLVRPAGHSTGTAGQALLVPMGGQSQMVTSVGKVPQPQTFVFPGNGQTPAYVLPQGLTSTLAGTNMLTTTQGARTTQPLLRLVAPQPPFQLQQINTASGTMYVAVPVGQTALNLPGVFATATNSVRTISPQVGPGTLQIGSNLAPVSLNQIQMTPSNLQVSSSNQPLQLSASLPTPLSSVITTTTTTTMATRPPEESISLATTPSTQTNVHTTSQVHVEVNKNNSKKKSKKKKKEKDSKEDKGKGKGVSINLNELLKETGIFDENEFGGLGIEEPDSNLAISQGIVQAQPPTTNYLANSVNCKVSAGPNQLILSTPVSQSVNSVALNHNITSAIIATSCSTNTLGQNSVPVTTIPTSMCLTFDVHGKLVLGSSDVGKPHITAIAGSVPTQVMSPGGVGLNLNPGGTFVIGNSEGSIPLSKNTMTGVNSMGHLVALHPPAISHLGEVTTHSPSIMKFDGMHPQLITTSKATGSQTQNEIVRVVQNTQMIQSPDKSINHATSSLLTSLLSNPVPPIIGVSSGTSEAGISVNLTGSDKVSVLHADGKQITDFASNGIIGTHPSQLPINPAVIVSSYANSFLPGAILSGKTSTVASPSFNLVTTTTNSICSKNTNTLPISVNIIDNNKNLYNSQYSTSILNSNVVETKVKKSNKKKKKEKEAEVTQVSYLTPTSIAYQEKSKNNSLTYSNSNSLSTSVLIHNGDASPGSSIGIKTEGISSTKSENNNSPVYSTPNFSYTNAVTTGTVTSNSVVSTMPNSKAPTYIAVSTSSIPNSVSETTRASMPLISTHTNLSPSSGFIVQPGQQVKQLLISPQNQEALKRVHSQIQDIQNKKGPLGEQDKALQNKLISEYKKIMATGTPVQMAHSSLSQLPHSISTASQHNPIKYSHSVGHKKIFLTPKGYSQSHPQSKKHFSEVISKLNDSKSKDNDSAPAESVSSTNVFSSHSISSSSAGFTVSVSPAVTQTNLTTTTSSNSFSSVQQLISSSGQDNQCSKPTEIDSTRQSGISSTVTAEVATNTCSNSSNRNVSPSMPVIIMSTKASSVHSIPTCSSTPLSSSHSVGMANIPITQFSPVPPPPSTPIPSPVHSVISPQTSFSSSQLPSPISVGMLSPQTPSTSQVGVVAFSQQHSSTSSSINVSPMRSPFNQPLTKDQLFEHQLRTDQNGALNPDYKTHFKNKTDACKRLIRYHVYNDYAASPFDLMESDHQFEAQSEALIKKFAAMQYKYKSLLLKESMRRHASSETAMLYRLFVQEEKNNLEREKIEVVNGKDLDLPPPPRHWISGEPPPAEAPFPWEEEWPKEKVFVYTPNEVDPIDEEVKEEPESSLLSDDIHPITSEMEGRGRHTSHTEEDEGISSRITNQWEEDFEEECQDEGRLQILMEEETDESKSQEGGEEPIEEGTESLPSDSGGYFSRSPGNQDDSEPLDERTSRTRHSSSDVDNSKINNKVVKKDVWKNYNCYSSNNNKQAACVEDENCLVKTSSSTKENGLDVVSPLSSMNSVESRLNNSFERVPGFYNNILMDKKGSEKVEKYKHDKKLKSERERKKHERIKERERSDKEDGKEGKSSKKLKIKLKQEDKAIVRPLRIKSDERSCSGGLKLTLKKQEGSSGYYRVGDERGREYRVEKDDEEDRDSILPALERNNSQDDQPESDRHMKNVSIVLEDCLQVDSKVRKEPDEQQRGYKKSKRLKTTHHPAAKDDYETNRHTERENSVSWSSKFVDTLPPSVDRFLDRPMQQNNNAGFFYQSHQYALESSLSQKQSLCVTQQGQKMVHQSSRSSHRLS